MNVLKYAFKWDIQKKIPLINWLAVWHDVIVHLKVLPATRIFNLVITVLLEPKTFKQINYFHSDGVLGRIIFGYRQAGYRVPLNDKMAKVWVKNKIKVRPEIMFMEEIEDDKTGNIFYALRSFKDASKDEMRDITDKCIQIYGEAFGIKFETVKEYKKRERRTY